MKAQSCGPRFRRRPGCDTGIRIQNADWKNLTVEMKALGLLDSIAGAVTSCRTQSYICGGLGTMQTPACPSLGTKRSLCETCLRGMLVRCNEVCRCG